MKLLGSRTGYAFLILVAGCCCRLAERAQQPDVQSRREIIEARAELVFINAVLIKPRATQPAAGPAFTLAPLVVKEVAVPHAVSNCGPAIIFYQPGAVQIAGINRPQMTYLWFDGSKGERWQGVRLTLDSRGLPAIWEVLSNRPGPHVVFVSRSLEEKAHLAFGPPVPGRVFSIEEPLALAPNCVVARVIDDGPVAMGPIIHETASGEISAVICRCMPTQAKTLVATEYFDLKPLLGEAKERIQVPKAIDNLDQLLRLPPN